MEGTDANEASSAIGGWRGVGVYAAAGVALLIWAGTPIVTKIAVAHVDAIMVGVLRTLVPAAIVAPLSLRFWPGFGFRRAPRRLVLLGASAFGGFVGFPLLFSIGIEHTTSSHAALILAAIPVFSGLFAALIERRRPRSTWWFGVALAFLGEYLLIGFRLGFTAGDASVFGDLVLIAASVAGAQGYVSGARLAQTTGTWAVTIAGVTLGGLMVLPLFAWRSDVDWSAVAPSAWTAIGYLALLSTLLAYVCWYWALSAGGIARIAASQFAQPVMTIALAALILGERITWPLVASAFVFLGGVYVAQRR